MQVGSHTSVLHSWRTPSILCLTEKKMHDNSNPCSVLHVERIACAFLSGRGHWQGQHQGHENGGSVSFWKTKTPPQQNLFFIFFLKVSGMIYLFILMYIMREIRTTQRLSPTHPISSFLRSVIFTIKFWIK